jgi:xanthine dehydrogenase YagR molybdenum-binding subunit
MTTMATVAIGQPISRKDGVAKVTGAARYAADFAEAGMAYAQLVTSRVAKGRIAELDTSAAESAPGVQLVLTHRNVERLQPLKFMFAGGPAQSSFMPLMSDEIRYAGQTIALVVADTKEAADDAAERIEVAYRAEPAAASIHDEGAGAPADAAEAIKVGDAEGAFTAAEVKVDARYTTPAQHHNPIELYSTTAIWQGDRLTVHLPSQWVKGTQFALAHAFDLPPDDVQVISPYVGGGFGCKATVMPHTVLLAAAARRVGRPVKLVVSREAMYTAGSFRPATMQRVALGASRDGRLQALIHEQSGQTSRFDQACFPGTGITARMYAAPNIRTRETVIATDVNTPGFMRAPFETPTFFGLESAMDELAVALGMDPVELRIRNEPDRDPTNGLPWSSRSLVQCYRRAAERFGWSRRTPEPGSMRDGDVLIGWGCATATYPTLLFPASARLRLSANGSAWVGCAAHDIGTGTYTIAAQIVADRLGIPMDQITVELGDSRLPSGPFAGGSVTSGSLSGALVNACDTARERLLQAATAAGGPLAGVPASELRLEDGEIVGPDGAREPLAAVLNRMPAGVLEVEGEWAPAGLTAQDVERTRRGGVAIAGPSHPAFSAAAFGAEFVEVRINPRIRTIRAPRMVGVFAAGRILNAKTARSQLMGGMVWGLSNALLEKSEIDRKRARFVNTNIAEYHVAVNADVVSVEVEMLDEKDELVNPLGVKGIGELGIVGTSAAVANAVYHATGIRVRKTPILIEDILPAG